MFIASVEKALPAHKYRQEELTEVITSNWNFDERVNKRLSTFHQSVKVETRHLCLPKEAYGKLETFTSANNAFIAEGMILAEAAVRQALASAQTDASEIDAIFFTSVTGVAVPTMDARLINRLEMRSDVKRYPFFGLGCVAGVAGLARVADYLKAYPKHKALLVSLELCSLTWQENDSSVANLIATGLFGDGAACVVCHGTEASTAKDKPEILASLSHFFHHQEDVMGWDIGSSGFKVVLNAEVPNIVRTLLPEKIIEFLTSQNLTRQDIASWVCHPGGPKVLWAMEEAMNLSNGELDLTWQSLKSVGNLSSASVLHVLSDTLKTAARPKGAFGLMVALGPGFCAELVLFRW